MMEADLKDNLRRVGEQFCSASDLAPATIWSRAAKDARFMERIESGKGFTVKSYDSAMRWFSANWPSTAIWPASVPRPVPEPIEAPQ